MKEITIQIPDRFTNAISLTCIGKVNNQSTNVTAIAALIEDGDEIIINNDGTFEIAADDLTDEYED